MNGAAGAARRESRVAKVRYCALCKQTVDSGHKFVWLPVGRLGYYRLQHRDCDFPSLYEHDSLSRARLQKHCKNRVFWGRATDTEQRIAAGGEQ